MSGLWSFHGVSVRQGGRLVLEGASFSVAAGEIVGVLGPNGAGKTTLIRAGLGLAESAGGIELGGKPLKALNETERASCAGYLPQERRVAWNLPAWRVAALGAPHQAPKAARAKAFATLDVMAKADPSMTHSPSAACSTCPAASGPGCCSRVSW
mgnify:CR=1 FL=1